MFTVTDNEKSLVTSLTKFTQTSYDMLKYICYGMQLAESAICHEAAKKDISDLRSEVLILSEIIFDFKIGIDTSNGSQKLWIVWNKTGSTDKYHYRDNDNTLSEKMLSFIIMTFEKEIQKRLSLIERVNDNYTYFGSTIKDSLNGIIKNYMTS